MFNDLPDVLMGDIFVEALSAVPLRVCSTESPTLVDAQLSPHDSEKEEARILSSADYLKMVDTEQANFFLFTTPAISGGSSSSLNCDACNLIFRKSSSFIRCAECTNPIMYLCATCFSTGAELGSHKRTHSYVVITSRNNHNLFSKSSSPRLAKLEWKEVIDFFMKSEKMKILNFSDFEKTTDIPKTSGTSRSGPKAIDPEIVAEVPTMETERMFFSLLNILTRNFWEDPVWPTLPVSSGEILGGGPGNYNPLRCEFEHEYLPEAETLLAAVDANDSSLVALFDAYSLLLDERERRRKIIVEANLFQLKEFAVHKKKDSREMFEKCKMFIRPGMKIFPQFVESLASVLTQRKRCLDRLKRLCLLHKNGVSTEDSSSVQFDIDRKKRNDLNARRASVPGTKVWTFLSKETPNQGALAAIKCLPGGDELGEKALALCLELHIAPQHYIVTQLAIETVNKRGGDLTELIQNGIFGTTRRYLLAAQGLPVSATGGISQLSLAEMKEKLIECCLT